MSSAEAVKQAPRERKDETGVSPILNRYNMGDIGGCDALPCRQAVPQFALLAIGLATIIGAVRAQTVRVDVTAAHALAFDPDKAMGSSMDILPAKDFETVYSEPIIKESLSAGWGPITYRQNTELTINAWHWNPNGTWSDAKNQSGYFVGSAEPGDSLRQSFGYTLPHRGSTRSDAGKMNIPG